MRINTIIDEPVFLMNKNNCECIEGKKLTTNCGGAIGHKINLRGINKATFILVGDLVDYITDDFLVGLMSYMMPYAMASMMTMDDIKNNIKFINEKGEDLKLLEVLEWCV